VLWGQSFEVASIRPAEPYKIDDVLSGRTLVGVKLSGSRVSYGSVTVRTLIALAFEVKPYQVKGSGSLDSGRFDIAATLPQQATAKDVPAMLRALLSERFGLVIHREMRGYEAEVLSVAKSGVRMTRLPPEAPEKLKVTGAGDSHIEFEASINAIIAGFIGVPHGLPVVDKTGLEGVFAGSVDTSRYRPQGASEPRASFRESLDQLGLRLDRQVVTLATIVVDSVRSIPSDN